MNPSENLRYQRQVLMKEFGAKAQQKLSDAKLLVIGAGGLGCPALQYLSAAGVGQLGIVDFDVVSETNLHRQILYTHADIGEYKTTVAAKKITLSNPDVRVIEINNRLTQENALEEIAKYDLVIDGTDNFFTRYMINDACAILNKPLVYGSVLKFEGQVGVFNLEDPQTKIKTSYRDLFPTSTDSVSCSEAGVLGVLPGIIGTLQATEAIKIITGVGKPLCNSILTYNALNNSFHTFTISPQTSGNQVPQTKTEFMNFDYRGFCNETDEISVKEFNFLRGNENITILDVREINELPLVENLMALSIPLSEIEHYDTSSLTSEKIIVFCKSGARSKLAVKMLKGKNSSLKPLSLSGGIEAWLKNN